MYLKRDSKPETATFQQQKKTLKFKLKAYGSINRNTEKSPLKIRLLSFGEML